ncbi:MAG TPA: SHD1 domain-containing protein [Luteolibacter sp.]
MRLRSRPLAILASLASLVSLALAEENSRTWTDVGGRSFEGTFLSATPTKISIRRNDGKTFEVDRTRLSPADLDYVTKRNATPATETSGPAKEATPDGPMLAGYDGSANFDVPWPDNPGVDQESPITVVEENVGEKRFIYESPHFRFQSNVLLRPSLLQKVALMFEGTYQMHHDLPLNNRRTRSPKAGKLKARLFETADQYRASGGPAGTAGVYKGGDDEFMVYLEGLGVQKVGSGYMFDYKGDFHTVYHELTHQLWADLGGYAGTWMVEGFAEYVACAPFSNGRFSFIKQPRYALEYATGYGKKDQGGRALGNDITMPKLSKLMTMSQAEFYSDGNKNYGLGLLLTYYFILLDGDGDAKLFKDCVKALQTGKSEEDARKVLLNGRSYDDLEKSVSTAFRRKGIKIAFQ